MKSLNYTGIVIRRITEDTMKTPIVPCGLKPKMIYRSSLARCSGSVKVPTAPVTSARTGFWISAAAPQPKQKHSMQSWRGLKLFAAAEKAGRMSTKWKPGFVLFIFRPDRSVSLPMNEAST